MGLLDSTQRSWFSRSSHLHPGAGLAREDPMGGSRPASLSSLFLSHPTTWLSPAVRGQGGPLTSSIQDHHSGQRAEPVRVNSGYGGASKNPKE